MSYGELAHLVTFRPLERPVPCRSRISNFRGSWSSTVALLAKELRMHGARRTVLEVDMGERDLRIDGMPRANAKARTPGIVLSFEASAVPGNPHLRYEVGTYYDWQDNLRAIAKGLEALRAVDRYGVTKRGEQYAGWKQLASGRGDPSPARGADIVGAHGSVRAALKATHPDHGGDPDAFADVQAYRERTGG